MRHKRAKTYKRAISIYTTAFGFRQPYQVLGESDVALLAQLTIVSNDILLALNRESDIFKQLAACCQGEIKPSKLASTGRSQLTPVITQCCVEALYAMGKDVQAVTDIAKTFERRRCNHRQAIPPDECLKDVVGETNKHRYVLAVQSVALRNALVNVPGLPIIHFNPRGVLVLSPPSRATLKHKDAQEHARRLEGADILAGVEDGDNVVGGGTAAPVKRTRAKGPNPLSVKKKKSEPPVGSVTGTRREKKLAKAAQAGRVETARETVKRTKTRKRGKGLVQTVREEMAAEAGAEAAKAPGGGEAAPSAANSD